MNVVVNGQARSLADDMSVEELTRRLGAAPTGVAVAVNDEVVARSAWATTGLHEGDRVEVLGAMKGG